VSSRGLQRLPGVLEQTRPALVVLCHGGNDILRKQPLDRTTANLREMIGLARASGAQVVLLGVPRFGLFLDSAKFYAEVAELEAVPLEADAISDILSDNALKSDAVHPNTRGYAVLAEAVYSLLRERGAL
jgi:lysophospholipase L1-like esterase